MGTKERANMAQEGFLKGRRVGVEGTHGTSRKGTAEKTVIAGVKDQSDSGSVQPDLTAAAHGMYRKAVENKGDSIGDRALFDR